MMNMSMIQKRSKAALFALSLLCALPFLSCSQDDDEEPVITSFSFTRSGNSAVTTLTKDVTGLVDSSRKVITVYLPAFLYESTTDRAALTASIGVSGGSVLNTTSYASSPANISVQGGNTVKTYLVNLLKETTAVKNGTLLFTEYYSGQKAAFKGANNQYIEITNMSDSAVDLSAVTLSRHVWEDGVRVESKDQSVPLTGTLPAAASLVLYSQRCSWFSTKSNSSSVMYQSDNLYNAILTTEGQDGFTLTCSGTVLDVLGPNAGEGSGWNWGVAKKMQRKADVTKYKKWDESEWLTTKVSNEASEASTAGKKTASASSNLNTVDYFALEGLDNVVYGSVDDSSLTIEVRLNDTVSTTQKITVSTAGREIRYKNKKVVSGETEVDFSDDFMLEVTSTNGDVARYTVTCEIVHYNFSSALSGDYGYSSVAPADGKVVLIYNESSSVVLGTTLSSSTLQGVAVEDAGDIEYLTGMAALCVTVDSDGYYTFTCNGKYLACNAYSDSTGNVQFDSAPGAYTLWELESDSDGGFFIKSVNAKSGSNQLAFQYYSGKFSTYRSQTGSAYKFKFYIKKD